jgi:hypothetical protein
MNAKRSVLHVLVAVVCGAVLGIAAVIAISKVVSAAPARFSEPLGKAFSVLVAALVVSLVVRFLVALFSPALRASMAAHRVAHAVSLGAAIILVAFAFFSQAAMRYLDTPMGWPNPWWEIRWSNQPRYEGRTMAQWLRVLRSEPGRSGSPLDIIRVYEGTNIHTTVLEVPLSYDLLREHDFLNGAGNVDVVIDGGGHSVHHLRGTNGNCLLLLDWDREQKLPGLHKIEVDFLIGEYLHERGSTQAVVFADYPLKP